MRYALLIYTAEETEAPPPEVQQAVMDGYTAFTAHVRDRGAYEAGEALDSTTTATTVRVRDGRTLTTDGPYAETKEALGGFYIVEAADLDEAIGYASMIPGAARGAIEVRPIFDWSAAAAEATAAGSAGAT
ncbi:MAG: YciI family protein [Chloroflexota bacterium]